MTLAEGVGITEKTADVFLDRGVMGAVIVVLLIAVYGLWRELQKERAARIDSLRSYTEQMLKTNDRVHDTLDTVAKLVTSVDRDRSDT